jgi:hypothetical protein
MRMLAVVLGVATGVAFPGPTVTTLTFPGQVVAVASDGPYVAVAEGRSAHDCDRVSVWDYRLRKAVRLGRSTRCEPGSRITAVSIARNRALWVHRSGGSPPRWTVWTATNKRPHPRLLASTTGGILETPPIVTGPGNYDRRQAQSDDVLPYAVGAKVVVLNADGSRSYQWTAPAPVTALGSDPGVLVAAVADGRIFILEGGKVTRTFPGTVPASRVFWDLGVVAQRDRTVEIQGSLCTKQIALLPGQKLLASSGGRLAIASGTRVDVRPACAGRAFLRATGTAAALDNARFTIADGHRVTTRLIPEP